MCYTQMQNKHSYAAKKQIKLSFRQDIVNQSIARYKGMVRADVDGQHPLYRPREWEQEEIREEKNKQEEELDYERRL